MAGNSTGMLPAPELLTAWATIAAAIIALLAVFISTYLQLRSLRRQSADLAESLEKGYQNQVRALESVQRREAYAKLLSNVFDSGIISVLWRELDLVSDEVDTLQANSPAALAAGQSPALAQSCNSIQAKIALLRVAAGLEGGGLPIDALIAGSTDGHKQLELLQRMRLETTMEFRGRNRAVLMAYSSARSQAVFAGSPVGVIERADSAIKLVTYNANHKTPLGIDTIEAQEASGLVTRTVDQLEQALRADIEATKRASPPKRT